MTQPEMPLIQIDFLTYKGIIGIDRGQAYSGLGVAAGGFGGP